MHPLESLIFTLEQTLSSTSSIKQTKSWASPTSNLSLPFDLSPNTGHMKIKFPRYNIVFCRLLKMTGRKYKTEPSTVKPSIISALKYNHIYHFLAKFHELNLVISIGICAVRSFTWGFKFSSKISQICKLSHKQDQQLRVTNQHTSWQPELFK